MRISKHIHSCLLIEDGDTKILVDPGIFSFRHNENAISAKDFQGITAVFITHCHVDHVDPAALKEILAGNPGATVYANTDTEKLLHNEEISVEVFETGKKQVGSVAVDALPANHEKLLIPEPQNTAYAFNKQLLVTGDSFDERLGWFKNIPVLALPITAPWANQLQIVAFAKFIAPKIVVPVHDGYVKDFYRDRTSEVFAKYLADFDIGLHPLDAIEYLEI